MEENTNKQFLTEHELMKFKTIQSEITKLKINLAEATLQKHGILKQIDFFRTEITKFENELVEKYGKDSVINIQTGEVKRK
jgi:hypothetical protein